MLGSRVLVGDVQRQEVRVYASSGELVGSISAATGTPIGYLRAVLRCPDQTAAVVDAEAGRVLYVTNDGTVARSAQVPRSFTASNSIVACVGAGALLALQKPAQMADTGLIRSPVALIRATPDRANVDTLGSFAGDDEYFSSELSAYTPVVFGRSTLAAVGGGSVFVGETGEGAVTEYTTGGGRRATAHAGTTPRPATPSDVAAYEAAQRAQLLATPLPQLRWRLEQVRRLAPKMKTIPAFEKLAADDDGRLWVKPYAGPGEGIVDWGVYTATGARVATVPLPAAFEVTDIGRSYVLGIQTKANGSQVVQVYSMSGSHL